MPDIPNIIRYSRLEAGMTQKELATKIGESQQNLDKIEHGQRVLSLPTALRIARVLGISLDELAKEAET